MNLKGLQLQFKCLYRKRLPTGSYNPDEYEKAVTELPAMSELSDPESEESNGDAIVEKQSKA